MLKIEDDINSKAKGLVTTFLKHLRLNCLLTKFNSWFIISLNQEFFYATT